MAGRPPIYTALREHVERGLDLIEDAMRDGVICTTEQAAIFAHHKVTLQLSEEHETTTKLALGLLHGGRTRRTVRAAREYDALYGTGELTEQLATG